MAHNNCDYNNVNNEYKREDFIYKSNAPKFDRPLVTDANKMLLVFSGLFFLFQIVLMLMIAMYGPDYLNNNTYKILFINQYVIVLGTVLLYTFKKKLNVKEVFRLRWPGIKPCVLIIFMAVPAFFAAVMLNTLVIYFLQFIGNIPSQPIPVPLNFVEYIKGLLIVAVSPAICEELMHRGIILSAYERRGTSRALIFSALFFGFFHFDVTNLLGPIFLGLMTGYYVVRTNSIFAGMLAHFLNNAISETLAFLFRHQQRPETTSIGLTELIGTVVYGSISIVILLFLLKLFKKHTKNTAVSYTAISEISKDFKSIASHWPVIIFIVLYIVMSLIFILSIAVRLQHKEFFSENKFLIIEFNHNTIVLNNYFTYA